MKLKPNESYGPDIISPHPIRKGFYLLKKVILNGGRIVRSSRSLLYRLVRDGEKSDISFFDPTTFEPSGLKKV